MIKCNRPNIGFYANLKSEITMWYYLVVEINASLLHSTRNQLIMTSASSSQVFIFE